MKEKWREWFLFHRDEWSDVIPEELVDGSLPGKLIHFKCRKNWFYAVRLTCVMILEEAGVTEIPPEIKEFLDRVDTDEFEFKERTTAEDIELGNRAMTYMLENF